jgi:sugar porter (SP) family MFS transporter
MSSKKDEKDTFDMEKAPYGSTSTPAAVDKLQEYSDREIGGEALDSSSSTLNSYLVSAGLVCSLSSFVYGYNISVVGDMQEHFTTCQNIYSSTIFHKCVPCTTVLWSFVVGAFCIGGLIGALTAPGLTNAMGRKPVLFSHNLLYILGTLFLVLATSPSLLIVGRFFIGIGCGICTVAVPMYLSEIAPDKVRGILGIMFQAAIVLGIFFSQVIGFGISVDTNWRILFGIGGILPFIQMALIPLFVESPKWLASKGRTDDCVAALRKLRKGATEDAVRFEASGMAEKASSPGSENPDTQIYTVRKLVTSKEARMSLTIGMVFHAVQQLSGINAVFFFGGAILKDLGLDVHLFFTIITIWNILMTVVSIYLIDKFGRRPLILSSALLMVIADVFLTFSMYYAWKTVGLIFILVFVGGFAIGLGPVPWVINGDIFPSFALGAGSMICVGTNWVANTIVALSFSSISDALKSFTFLPFAVITTIFFFFALFLFPETLGKPPAFVKLSRNL